MFTLFTLGLQDLLVGLLNDGSVGGDDDFGPSTHNNTTGKITQITPRNSIVAGLMNIGGAIIAILCQRLLTTLINMVFEKTQKLKDGTVIASLLEAPPPCVGQVRASPIF